MVIKLDKNHRVKKTKLGWLPQWKQGWFIWRNYRLCTADTQMGNLIEFSEQKTPPVFDTSDHALDFIKKKRTQVMPNFGFIQQLKTYEKNHLGEAAGKREKENDNNENK